MKKLSSTLAIVSMIFFASCSKDDVQQTDPSSSAPKTQLEILQDGSWDLISMTSKASSKDTVYYNDTEAMTGKITFLKNNTVVAVLPGEENDTSAYVFNQSTIKIDDSVFDVELLNANSLELKSVEQELDNELGILIDYTTEISFKK
jgi:NAD(P)H-nitrite reductase large subunit